MPFTRKEGKDTIIFVTKEDHAVPSKIILPEPEPRPGLFLANGEINWNCPCLGGMATGPCGIEFRDAFTCFQKSSSTQKGSECLNVFHTMQMCMANYPSLYNKETDLDLEELENNDREEIQDQERIAAADVDKNSQIVISSKKEVEVAKH